jgi:cyclic pyranopterin monophosphate synthase
MGLQMTNKLTHVDPNGDAHMVDIGAKPITRRRATAEGFVKCSPALIEAIRLNQVKKGDVLAVARIAGIMAAKRVDELIPLCHTLPVEHTKVDLQLQDDGIRIEAAVSTTSKTGVEMEAITAASIAALTIIDMGKSIDKGMEIESIRVLTKSGGQSGDYQAPKRSGA